MVDVGELLQLSPRHDSERRGCEPLEQQREHPRQHAPCDGREQGGTLQARDVADDVDLAAGGEGDADQRERRKETRRRAGHQHVSGVLPIVEEHDDAKRGGEIDDHHGHLEIEKRRADQSDDHSRSRRTTAIEVERCPQGDGGDWQDERREAGEQEQQLGGYTRRAHENQKPGLRSQEPAAAPGEEAKVR